MKSLSLHFIINEMYSKNGLITDVNNAINAGVTVVHYNDKKLRKRQIVENAYILSALCKKNKVLFIMQDYPDVAALVGADGVHLTEQDFSISHVRRMLGDDKVIGVDFSSIRGAVHAEEAGVDYINLPITNINHKTIITRLKQLKELITIPIIATGDVSFINMEELIQEGIDGIALIAHFEQENQLDAHIKRTLTLLQSQSL